MGSDDVGIWTYLSTPVAAIDNVMGNVSRRILFAVGRR
jgi:hypothetical protein